MPSAGSSSALRPLRNAPIPSGTKGRTRRRLAALAVVSTVALSLASCGRTPEPDRTQDSATNTQRAERLSSGPTGFGAGQVRTGCNNAGGETFCGPAFVFFESPLRDPVTECRAVLTWAIAVGQNRYLEQDGPGASAIRKQDFVEPLDATTLDALVERCAVAPPDVSVHTGVAIPATEIEIPTGPPDTFAYTTLSRYPAKAQWELVVSFSSTE